MLRLEVEALCLGLGETDLSGSARAVTSDAPDCPELAWPRLRALIELEVLP